MVTATFNFKKEGMKNMSVETTTPNVRMTVYCALFTALIIIGAYISIPIPGSPVPVVLADFFVMLAGLFIGGKYGLLSVGLYLGVGVIGFPVFSNGGSGFAFLLGPTGGFLVGYLLLVAAIGFITHKKTDSLTLNLLALIIGNIFLYTLGITWLLVSTRLSLPVAIASGLLPFLPGTIIKIIVVLTLGKVFGSRIKESRVGA